MHAPFVPSVPGPRPALHNASTMSGPCTCGYIIFQGLLMLSARAIQEAQAMRREYGDVMAQLAERERGLARTRQGMRDARLERIAAVRKEASRQAARFARLASIADSVGATAALAPPAPTGDDDAAWTDYVRRLDAAVREIEAALGDAGAVFADKVRAALAMTTAAPSIDEVLAGYAQQRAWRPGLDAAQAERFRATAARVLARLELADGAPLPAELEALAQGDRSRADARARRSARDQLRLAVQRSFRSHTLRQRTESDEAQGDARGDARRRAGAAPARARACRRRCRTRSTTTLARVDARPCSTTRRSIASARRRQQRRSCSQQSLRDLGYEVEDIESTLFVDGGTRALPPRRLGQLFRAPARRSERERTINFNVVRASGDEETAERRRQDALAEDRWCAEFPKLLQTLEARGLALDVTRRLEAGEVPVQVVDASSLPRIEQDDDASPRAAPKARPIS